MPTAHASIVDCDNPALCSLFSMYGVKCKRRKGLGSLLWYLWVFKTHPRDFTLFCLEAGVFIHCVCTEGKKARTASCYKNLNPVVPSFQITALKWYPRR